MYKCICLYIVLFILLVGCEEEKYSIEMKPCEEGIERKFAFSGRLSDDERQRLSKLYQEQIDPNTFRGVFNENLPNDVGGAGFYTTFTTNMGKTAMYSERFRGDDDLNYTLENAQLLGDRFADFLIGWLEYELGNHPNFVDLKEFLDYDFRQDAKNIIIYNGLSDTLDKYDSNAADEIEVRMKNYLIERGYLGPKEMELFVQKCETDQEELLRVMRRLITEQMGLSCPHATFDWLEFLSDGERAEASAQRYIHSTEYFKEAWEAKKREENDPYAEPPDLDIDIIDFVMRDTDFILFDSGSGRIEVKLACDCEPFSTNGNWDDKSGQVVWSGSIAGDNDLPTFLYASWGEPNQAFQEEYFGCVALSGKRLSEYCIWREALDESKAEEWDAFVLSLFPGEDLEKQISDFRFSDYVAAEREADVQPVDLATKPRDLILAGLREVLKQQDIE